MIHYLSDLAARDYCGLREQWEPSDAVDHSAGGAGRVYPSTAVLRTLERLHDRLRILDGPGVVIRVMRDWEGCLVADVAGSSYFRVLALTESGLIGVGGINFPRYTSIDELLEDLPS